MVFCIVIRRYACFRVAINKIIKIFYSGKEPINQLAVVFSSQNDAALAILRQYIYR